MRLIDAEAFQKFIEKQDESADYTIYHFEEWLEQQPTIEAKPVVHAHWESTIYTVEKAPGEISKIVGYRCGNCGRIIEEFENYCPSCGAEMYEKRECLSSV